MCSLLLCRPTSCEGCSFFHHKPSLAALNIEDKKNGMGSTISNKLIQLFGKRETRLLMLGLDAAGKTSMLYRLKLGEVVTTIPTIGAPRLHVCSVKIPEYSRQLTPRVQASTWRR